MITDRNSSFELVIVSAFPPVPPAPIVEKKGLQIQRTASRRQNRLEKAILDSKARGQRKTASLKNELYSLAKIVRAHCNEIWVYQWKGGLVMKSILSFAIKFVKTNLENMIRQSPPSPSPPPSPGLKFPGMSG